LSLPIFFLES